MDITAELHGWRLEKGHALRPFPHYSGRIKGDTRRRFRDGDTVFTSQIIKVEGDILTTRYSVYKLVGPGR